MQIIYILSLLILTISFILVKKTDKKQNILSFFCITIGTLFCYNTFIAYILTFFTIPVTLLSLSIINLIFTAIFTFVILRKKQIQTYEINKIDLLYISLLGIAVLVVSYLNFGFPFNIKYETGDPSVHYLMSEMFAENDSLLIEDTDEVYGKFTTSKNVSYVNSGLIMKCLQGVIEPFYNYNIFIAFGIFVLFMTAFSMYATISRFAVDKKTRFLAFVVSLIYTMGYPLNSFLFGFEYLSMGILLICLVFDVVNYFKNKELSIPFIIGILALLNFGVFSAYFMFVPFLYPALWIYFCIDSYEKYKRIFTKKNLTLLVTTLLIPFFLGFIYHITPTIYGVIINNKINTVATEEMNNNTYTDTTEKINNNINTETTEIINNIANEMNVDTVNSQQTETIFMTFKNLIINSFPTYGYIYVNLYSNMLLLLPLSIYLIIKKWKENRFEAMNMIFCIAFIELLLVGFLFGKVSIYYLSKNYFVLWFILFYLNYKALVDLYKKHPRVSFGVVGFYSILIILNLLFVDTTLENQELNPNETPATVVEVFGANKTMLKYKKTDFYQDELEILKYLKDNISYDNKVEIIGDMEQGYWAYTLTRYINNKENIYIGRGQEGLSIKMLNAKKDIEKADYIVYFNRTNYYKKLEKRIHELGDIIFENASGGIVKCK